MLRDFLRKTIAAGSAGIISMGLMISTSPISSADDDPVATVTKLSDYMWDTNNQIEGSVFSPDGKKFVITSWVSNKVTVYDVQPDGSLTNPVDTHIIENTPTSPMVFSPDGNFLAYTINGYSYLRVLKINPDNTLSSGVANQVGENVVGFAFSPDGSSLVLETYSYGWTYLSTYQIDSNGILSGGVRSSALQNSVSSLVFTPDGKYLFGYSYGGVVSKWDVESDGSLSNKTDYQIGSLPYGSIKMSPDGNLLAVACDSSNVTILRINPDGTLSDRVDTPFTSSSNNELKSLAFSPDSQILAVGGKTSTMSLFRVHPDGTLDGKIDVSLGAVSGRPVEISFTPDGKFIGLSNSIRYISMFSVEPYSAPPKDGTVGTVNILVDSSISLTLNDDTVDLSDIPGATDVVTDDNETNYTVTTNNLEGYTVTIKADNATLDSNIVGNTDNIPVDLITVAQADSQNGTGSNATALSSTNDNQLYSQNQRSVEDGDVFTSTFNLTEVPWVNADDYSGTVTYTATAN